jgi:heptosyltransferase II
LRKYKINNILAISTTGIGNLVLYTPVLKALRRDFPESNITLLVGTRTAADLLVGSKVIDEIMVYHKDKRHPRYLWGFLKSIRKCRFDLVVTSFLDQSFKIALLSKLSGAAYRAGFDHALYGRLYSHRVAVSEPKHEIEYNLDLLRSLGIKIRRAQEKQPFVYTTAMDEELANDFFLKSHFSRKDILVGVHPGSGLVSGTAKRWPKEKYAKLCDQLMDIPRVKVIIFGGPEERYAAEEMARFMRKQPVIAAGEMSIKTTSCLIKRCQLFIANDSGLMHIATAVKTPVIAIFGPTLWWKNYPWGKNNLVIRKNLSCAPCYNYAPIKCDDIICLNKITVEEVLEKARQVLRVPLT